MNHSLILETWNVLFRIQKHHKVQDLNFYDFILRAYMHPWLPQLAISQNCNQQCYLIASRLCQQSDIDWLIH